MSLKEPGLPSDAAAAGGVKEKWVLTCHQREAIVAVVVVADHQQTDAPLHSTARYRVSHAQFIPLSKNELQSDYTYTAKHFDWMSNSLSIRSPCSASGRS